MAGPTGQYGARGTWEVAGETHSRRAIQVRPRPGASFAGDNASWRCPARFGWRREL